MARPGAAGGMRVFRVARRRRAHRRLIPGRDGARGVRGAAHERDAGPQGLRVQRRVRVRARARGREGRVPRGPTTSTAARARRHDPAGRRRTGSPAGRLRRVPVAGRTVRRRRSQVRRFRLHEAARLRDPGTPVAPQLVHVPHPEPRGRVRRARRRAQNSPRHMSVRRGGQLQRAQLVRGVLARLGRAADRCAPAAPRI